jgi:hypothetical protein
MIKEIKISDRTEGMVDASADYYQESKVFHAIQNTQALEYDRIYENNEDLALQLSPYTATWGLVFWEISVGLPPDPESDYDSRRPSIFARLANEESFGGSMVHNLAASYNEKIRVEIDTAICLVTITFQRGVPSFLKDFDDTLQNIIHAHLGVEYKFEYHIETGIQIETSYNRYVYPLPKAGTSTLCGTLPSVAVIGRLYESDVKIAPTYDTQEQDYKLAGRYAAGPKPYVSTEGKIYDAVVEVKETGTLTTKDYKLTNTIYSGGEPIK